MGFNLHDTVVTQQPGMGGEGGRVRGLYRFRVAGFRVAGVQGRRVVGL